MRLLSEAATRGLLWKDVLKYFEPWGLQRYSRRGSGAEPTPMSFAKCLRTSF